MSEILNKQFSSVFTEEGHGIIPVPTKTCGLPNDQKLESITFPPDEIIKFIDMLKAKKSAGPDKVSNRILKELKNEIASPLQTIFESSINTSICPEEWKKANITPIYKKGPKSKPAN